MKIPILKNTLTNYFGMFVRLIQGILITRWLIRDLGSTHYGFWIMLWSFFCFPLFLDLGLGVTVQKATASEVWKHDIGKFNRIVATVFFIHFLMSGVIGLCTLAGSLFLHQLLNLPPGANIDSYRQAFLIFGFGSTLIFPLGMFSEILVGLQKIYLRNYIIIGSKILELLGILILFRMGGGLIALVIFDMGLLLATQLLMTLSAFLSIPGFRFRIRFEKVIFREIFHFSFSAFIITLARLAWERGSTLLISIFCGLKPVSTYQIGCRLPVLMSQFTGPYQENISPMTALYNSRGKREGLSRILLNSMRWNSFLAAGMTIVITVFSGELIRFLFKTDDPEAVLISQVTAVSVCVWLVFRTIPERYLQMDGSHLRLAAIFTLESTLFVISAILILNALPVHLGLIVIMATSIGSKFLCTFLFLLPCLLRNTGLEIGLLLREAVYRPLGACMPVMAAALAIHWELTPRIGDFWALTVGGIVCTPLYLLCSYIFIFNPQERKKLVSVVKIFNPETN